MNKLTYEEAHRLFRYEAESGKLFWRVSTNPIRVKVGDEAGCVIEGRRTQYRRVRVFGERYLVHRIIWLMLYSIWPKHEVDHVDGNGLNNQINNLRDVPIAVNQRNRRMSRNNTSGINGVCWHKRDRKWYAQSSDGSGKVKYLGYFTDIREAEKAVREYQKPLGFTKRHGV